jgi:hypothetical protein
LDKFVSFKGILAGAGEKKMIPSRFAEDFFNREFTPIDAKGQDELAIPLPTSQRQ